MSAEATYTAYASNGFVYLKRRTWDGIDQPQYEHDKLTIWEVDALQKSLDASLQEAQVFQQESQQKEFSEKRAKLARLKAEVQALEAEVKKATRTNATRVLAKLTKSVPEY